MLIAKKRDYIQYNIFIYFLYSTSTDTFRIIKESDGESSQRNVTNSLLMASGSRAHCGTKASHRSYNSYSQDIAMLYTPILHIRFTWCLITTVDTRSSRQRWCVCVFAFSIVLLSPPHSTAPTSHYIYLRPHSRSISLAKGYTPNYGTTISRARFSIAHNMAITTTPLSNAYSVPS